MALRQQKQPGGVQPGRLANPAVAAPGLLPRAAGPPGAAHAGGLGARHELWLLRQQLPAQPAVRHAGAARNPRRPEPRAFRGPANQLLHDGAGGRRLPPERRRREAQIAKAVVVASETALELLTQSVALAQFEREQAVTTRQAEEAEVRKIRERIRELTADLEVLTDSVHRDEVARAEQRLRIEAMENKSVEDYGVGPEELLAEYGPEVMVPPSPPAPGDEVNPDDPEPEPYPYVRTQQESRLAAAERSLALLGKVNPLALEEFSALEERHKFLGEQLEDLRKSRNDLMSVIRDVDARVQEVFSQAYEDTAREFMLVFSRLFPGGEARMILTEPNDLLNSGVEIEARPPGKTYKRLSLLSGGEQSLTAVAFLIALFKSRPSPFYILDEVEAALDDVNLGRLLEILAELRTNSQLLIITHQKRTMEIADALYGVSMRGDGVTQVISQRITHDDHDNPEQRADAQMANNS